MPYIHEHLDWPNFTWDSRALMSKLGHVRNLQGKLNGKMEALGFKLRSEAFLHTLSQEVIKSSEIEGEHLNMEQVRSSIAVRLGVDISKVVPSDRNVDGAVDMMLDAIQNYKTPLTTDRLLGWHSALFPEGRSGLYKIVVGQWRDDTTGPMQVISGAMGMEKVHFQAPASSLVEKEMNQFLIWLNQKNEIDQVLQAGIAHLWFITIHPFDDGNGRIARAITELLLTRSENSTQRFYSMSNQIKKERNKYYNILESTQKGSLDITAWLTWFLDCLHLALTSSDEVVDQVLYKHHFWNTHRSKPFNKRQIKVIDRLLDNFYGKLTSSKWAKMNKCSSDTALRDIQDLINKGILQKDDAGGRSTNYRLI